MSGVDEPEVWAGTILPEEDGGKPCPHCGKWKGKKGGKTLDAWIKLRAPRMAREEIAGMKPFGGQWTVREQIEIFVDARRRIVEEKEPPEKVVESIGLGCETRFGGSACRLYCDAVYACSKHGGRTLAELNVPRVAIP